MMFSIAKEVKGITGYKTIEYIEKCLPYNDDTLKRIESMDVTRKFKDPFNNIMVIVIK